MNTTPRKTVSDLAKAKWSTKVKIWIGILVTGLPLVYAVITFVVWAQTEIAWAADVKQSQNVQFIQNQQDRVDDQLWKVKHDLVKIDERDRMNIPLATDSLDKETLLGEYIHLIQQKSTWAAKEKEATK